MLLEKIIYADDFPINIKLTNITEYPFHFHKDIEFIFVLKGNISLKNGCCTYKLPEGSVFTSNGHEVHGFHCENGDNIVAIIQISNLFFTQYFPNLPKSCYRTYTSEETDSRFDVLRQKLLLIIWEYLKRSSNYKSKCIDYTIQLIHYLNLNFNLFSFDKKMVVDFSSNIDNRLLIERMSKIINYIYAEHASNITLDDLSKMEHLSTYYISHMIKASLGMNFREFLCFARVESSEIPLLSTNKKISVIAKEVGFSTTSYYEKYFKKWFGRSPLEHRDLYAPLILSSLKTVIASPVPMSEIISAVTEGLSAVTSQETSDLHVQHIKQDITIASHAHRISCYAPKVQLIITLQDYNTLGSEIFHILKKLNCLDVIIEMTNPADAELSELLQTDLINNHCNAYIKSTSVLSSLTSYGFDSIAFMIYLFNNNMMSDKPIILRLIDPHSKTSLTGYPALLTSDGMPKPSYYACFFMTRFFGDLIYQCKNCSIVRLNREKACYGIFIYNYNDNINRLCTQRASFLETQSTINSFLDELNININLLDITGKYIITKYAFTAQNNIFNLVSKLGFSSGFKSVLNLDYKECTTPAIDIQTEMITDTLNLSLSFTGAGIHIVVIEPFD